MPSKKCPDCGKIVTSSQIPNYCAWCGCSLKEQPLISNSAPLEGEVPAKQGKGGLNASEVQKCNICEIYKTSEGKPLFGSKCPKLNTGRGEELNKKPETETQQADLPLSGADALLAELRKQREEREKAPVQLNMFKT